MKEFNKIEYYDKVFGGWIGRVVGSHFGTPIEFRPYKWIKKKYCKNGKKDITYYVKPIDPFAVNDDEIYQIVGLITLKRIGLNITSVDLAMSWKELLYGKQYTAEKIALENIKKDILPPDSASIENGNIFYDAIGAQMKGDIWGLICPLHPELAVKYAKIDGSIAHQGIGIDGEIFIATLIANAFKYSFKDLKNGIMKNLLTESLKFIDSQSLYYEMILYSIELYEKYENWRDARRILMKKWKIIRKNLKKQSSQKRRVLFLNKFLNFVHVLPNAGIIALSLLYSQDNFPEDLIYFDDVDNNINKFKIDPFGRPICLAGMMALDTDCNCGNIGTIIGVILGESKIPKRWKEPLKDEFHTMVKGFENWKISELTKEISNIGIEILNQINNHNLTNL